MPVSWRWLSVAIAVLAVVLAVLAVAGLYPFDVLAIGLVAGVLTPIWAIWLAMRAPDIWVGPEAMSSVEEAPYDPER
jgi:hypothetical protein